METDECDYSELGEPETEYCQVGNQSCVIPYDLYELPDLTSILSVDAWNRCLTEEERFSLTQFLPDMDQGTFFRTVNELLSGENLHFGSPLTRFFDMLKGGLCEPRVVLYRQGLNLLQRREYYQRLRIYHNSMVGNLSRMRDVFDDLLGYGIEEKLQFLTLSRSGQEVDCEDKGQMEMLSWRNRLQMNYKTTATALTTSVDSFADRFGKGKSKGKQKTSSTSKSGYVGSTGDCHLTGRPSRPKKLTAATHEYLPEYEYRDEETTVRNRSNNYYLDDMEEQGYEWAHLRDKKSRPEKMSRFGRRDDQESPVGFSGRETPSYHEAHSRHNKKSGHLEKDSNNSAAGDSMDYQTRNHHHHSKHSKSNNGKSLLEMRKDVNVKSKRNNLHNHADDYYLRDASDTDGRSFQYDMEHPMRSHSSYMMKGQPESDSSEHLREEEGKTCFSRKQRHTSSIMENHQHGSSIYGPRKPKKPVKDAQVFDDPRLSCMSGKDIVQNKSKNEKFSSSGNSVEDQNQTCGGVKNGKKQRNPVQGHLPPQKASSSKKKSKGFHPDLASHSGHLGDYPTGVSMEENMDMALAMMDVHPQDYISGDHDLVSEANAVETDNQGYLNVRLSGCKSVTKKRKSRGDSKACNEPDDPEDMQTSPDMQTNETVTMKKKGKRKADTIIPSTQSVLNNGTVTPENEVVEADSELRPARKPFTLITPTVHTGFSFSIVHLLSAVRKAMVTVNVEDACISSLEKFAAHVLEEQKSMPSLTVQEIMDRVRSNPGDPSILETQEPLQDLVRGVLKIFSSKTAPLGAKGWKALVVYEKSTKTWSWVGPTSPNYADLVEEETSAEAWSIPHKMLVKLVDSFANWLKSGQETLKQIGSLPPPPAMVLPNLDEKERFRDLRAQKSLTTICPSSNEVKSYFRREEFLRYQVPDRAFSYTTADGKKSIVAPLRRGGGKPTSKARDHFMLKPDRPPHVTILCLVRDAASRLPGSIGTRADVCALIRDSQYIMEDVSDAQVNQVVSGALDRLHYERDPCVQYDNERKLWVYLHRDREEEDFEDDGTSSTKKWKKPRKDTTDNSDTVAAEAKCNGDENQQQAHVPAGFNFSSESDMILPPIQAGERAELLYHDLRTNTEIVEPFIDSIQGTVQGNPLAWEVLGINPLQENRLLCQENSTNENFDEEAFGRERSLGLLNASLL